MRVYQLNIAPGEDDAEGEDRDEWFATLAEAKSRRRQLIARNPWQADHIYGADYAIDRWQVRQDLPHAELVAALLSGRRWAVAGPTRVVPHRKRWRPDRRF